MKITLGILAKLYYNFFIFLLVVLFAFLVIGLDMFYHQILRKYKSSLYFEVFINLLDIWALFVIYQILLDYSRPYL